MKIQKLLLSAAAACLLLGTPGAAMARNDCPNGSITGGTYTEIIINEFVSCSIVGVHVTGEVRVANAEDFTMIGSLVEGRVRVTNTRNALLLENSVDRGDLVARGNLTSTVVRNTVLGGNISVNDDSCRQDQQAIVGQNLIYDGSLRVNCNETANVKDNSVIGGDIICRDNDRLDSTGNRAEGRVNCIRNLFQ